jgi:hypothetical protein
MKPHKHAEILIQWINGATIQSWSPTLNQWDDIPDVNSLDDGDNYLLPNPLHPDYDYMDFRIKP